MEKRSKLTAWATVACGLMAALMWRPGTAAGSVPELISFQGILRDGNGDPVADSNYTLTVGIYDAPSGTGQPLWSDSFVAATSGGLFNVQLGSGSPLPVTLFANPNLWVGVSVGADPEVSPRTQLTSVPYSARVGTVDGATGGIISGDVSIQSNLAVDGAMGANSLLLTKNPGPSQVPLVIQDSSGQLGNLLEIRDITGAIQGSFDENGALFTRFALFGHNVTCEETLSTAVASAPVINLTGASPTISNFPNPVPIEIKTSKGSMYLGRNDGRLQQVSAAPGAGVSILQAWDNGTGQTVASLDTSGEISVARILAESGTITHELGHNLGMCHEGTFLECSDALGNPVASIDTLGDMTWENGHCVDLNCDGALEVTGDATFAGGFQTTGIAENPGNDIIVSLGMTCLAPVGILTPPSAATGFALDVAGSAHASSFPTSSDERLKTNVQPLTDVVTKLQTIRGVSFDWNETYEKLGRSTGHREIGVIAQEVEKVFPDLVTRWGDEQYRAIDYSRFSAVLLEAVKEQQKTIEGLNGRIETLEKLVQALLSEEAQGATEAELGMTGGDSDHHLASQSLKAGSH